MSDLLCYSEGANILAGFGYDPRSQNWNSLSNMDIVAFELAGNIRTGSRSWNQRTQQWIERIVYVESGKSLVATYFVSAFWHGFYPGYYIFFMTGTLWMV